MRKPGVSLGSEVAPDFGTSGIAGRSLLGMGQDGAADDEDETKIDAVLKAKIAVEAVREQATVGDLAQRHQDHPNEIYAWKKQLLDHAARAFDSGVGVTRKRRRHAIEKLHAKIGQLTFGKIFRQERRSPNRCCRIRRDCKSLAPNMLVRNSGFIRIHGRSGRITSKRNFFPAARTPKPCSANRSDARSSVSAWARRPDDRHVHPLNANGESGSSFAGRAD